MKTLHVIDSHTGGEPTRLVLDGFPPLPGASMAERRDQLAAQDQWRRAVMLEPRGNDVLVGALLCPPVSEDAVCGVIFFNNSGYLNMCGHGTIGLVASLAYLGRIQPGRIKIDTPVGPVDAELHADGAVTVRNVPAWRQAKAVALEVPGYGRVVGDVAWGGNWFFLVAEHGQPIDIGNVQALTEFTWAIRQALPKAGITGAQGAEIDHIELFAPGENGADSRNFVLCPGQAYDRSPCGTGTSAKLACLAADGKLAPGQIWRQAGITGSRFEAYYQTESGQAGGECIRPYIKGRAHITADARLIIDEQDPFAWGISG